MQYDSIEGGTPITFSWPNVMNCSGQIGTAAGSVTVHPPVSTVLDGPDNSYDFWKNGSPSPGYNDPENKAVLMSDYSTGLTEIIYSLARTKKSEWHRRWFWYVQPNVRCCDEWVKATELNWEWIRDFEILSATFDTYVAASFSDSKVQRAISITRNACVADSFNGFDLLTEIAEAEQSVKTIQGLVIAGARLLKRADKSVPRNARGWKKLTVRKLLKSGDLALRRAGSTWLGFIYGILPIVFSIEDVLRESKNRSIRYESYHSQREIQPDLKTLPSLPPEHLLRTATGTIRVRSTTRVGYELGAIQRIANRVGFNLARTAYEKIPFSFVVDWFLNVGTVITAHTSLDLSSWRASCTSISRNTVEETLFADTSQDVTDHRYTPAPWDPCSGPPSTSALHVYERADSTAVKTASARTYERTIFKSPPLKISYEAHLDWKRTITGLALAFKPISTTLRRLR